MRFNSFTSPNVNKLFSNFVLEAPSLEARVVEEFSPKNILISDYSAIKACSLIEHDISTLQLIVPDEVAKAWVELIKKTISDLSYSDFILFWGILSSEKSDRKTFFIDYLKDDPQLLSVFELDGWDSPLNFGHREKSMGQFLISLKSIRPRKQLSIMA